jgi:DNA repair protein RAD50
VPLTKEKEKLFQHHSGLKTQLEREFDELAERKRSFQHETETLENLNNRIKESVIPFQSLPFS